MQMLTSLRKLPSFCSDVSMVVLKGPRPCKVKPSQSSLILAASHNKCPALSSIPQTVTCNSQGPSAGQPVTAPGKHSDFPNVSTQMEGFSTNTPSDLARSLYLASGTTAQRLSAQKAIAPTSRRDVWKEDRVGLPEGTLDPMIPTNAPSSQPAQIQCPQ